MLRSIDLAESVPFVIDPRPAALVKAAPSPLPSPR
jgi:hypothetical protein